VIARASVLSATVAALLIACAAIDAPAPFVRPEAGAEEAGGDAAAYGRCRLLDRQFITDARARVYGEAPGPQAVCVTVQVGVPAAGTGTVVFCVAGALEDVTVPSVRELTSDLESCAFCADVQTNCPPFDAGTPGGACATPYAVLAGRARVVRLGRTPGESVWVDIGGLEVARVTRRDGAEVEVERRDCLFADGLTLQGVLERGSTTGCTSLEATACAIASTAASRSP